MFDQWFVYCGVCYRRSSVEDPLLLTSCAHILCSQHWNSSFKSCSVCRAGDISVIKLSEEKRLPQDILVFFQPFEQLLEMLYNVSQFQTIGLVNQCKHSQEYIVKLQATCAKQRQILYQTKSELELIPKLKQQIKYLQGEVSTMKNQSNSVNTKLNFKKSITENNNRINFSRTSSRESFRYPSLKLGENNGFLRGPGMSRQPPPTVDLTMDDDDNNTEAVFLKKLKKNTTLKNSSFPKTPDIVAESTHLSQSFNQNSFINEDNSPNYILDRKNNNGLDSSNITSVENNSKLKLPTALENLRVIKRSSTTTVAPSRTPTDEIKRGILNHMKSSGGVQKKELTRAQSSFQTPRRSASSQQILSKFNRSLTKKADVSNSKIKRIR